MDSGPRIITLLLIMLIFQLVGMDYSAKAEETKTLPFRVNSGLMIDNEHIIRIDKISDIQFNTIQYATVNLGFTKADCWLKHHITNCKSTFDFFYYEIRNPYLEEVTIYLLQDGKVVRGFLFGSNHSRVVPVKFGLWPKQSITVIVKVGSRSPVTIPFEITDSEMHLREITHTNFYKGIFYGIFWLVFIIALYVIVLQKSRFNLYFALSTLFTIIYIMGQDNLMPVLPDFVRPDILIRLSNMVVPLLAFSFIAFSRTFFNVREKTILRAFYFLYAYAIVHLILYFYHYYWATRLSFYSIPLVTIILMAISLYMYFKLRQRFVKLYIFATFCLLLGILIHVFGRLGLISDFYLTLFAFKTGFLLQLLVYLLAMSMRYTVLQRDFTLVLESKVDERTHEVEMVNEELVTLNEQLKEYQLNLENTVSQRTAELLKLNQSLNTLIKECPVAIFDVDNQINVLSVWNPAAERIFGWTAEEVIGNSIPYIAQDTRAEYEKIVEELKRGKAVTNLELKRRNKRGNDIYVRSTLIPLINDENLVDRILIFSDDITDRKKMLDAIQESETKFRTLFLSSKMGIIIFTTEATLIDSNPAFIEMTGFGYNDLILNPVTDFIPEEYHPVFQERIARLLNGEKLTYWEFEIKRKNNQPIFVEGFDSLIELGGRNLFMTVVIDITDQKNYQQRIFESILQTEEIERKRFAGDLHDELGPQLASLRIYASSLKKRTRDPEMLGIVEEMMDNIKLSINNVREISNNLSPHLLENYGLAIALKSESDLKRSFFDLNFKHNIDEKRFDHKIEIVIYRICKELLNNTLKYAQASQVELAVHFENNYLNLFYSDNGIGFNYAKLIEQGRAGLGIMNIQSRIKSVQGTYHFHSYPGQGVVFNAKIYINT